MISVKAERIVLCKQGPQGWLCQTAGAAAPSGGSGYTQWASVGATSP